MFARLNVAGVVSIVSMLCAPAMAFDQSAALTKDYALHRARGAMVRGLPQGVQGARAEARENVNEGRLAPSGGFVYDQAYPQRSCNFFGGDGVPVQVCW